MLLRPTVSFTDVDDRSFDVTLADHGQTVTHESFWTTTDTRSTSAPPTGTPTSPAAWSRPEWTTPIDGWKPDADRLAFTRGKAVWQLPDGPPGLPGLPGIPHVAGRYPVQPHPRRQHHGTTQP